MSDTVSRPANRLINESSPYLLSHAHNPVNWYPWGDEAIATARERDVPIFLSIGYAACHWCHVMERESFENEPIAKLLNERFVAIKVDREQRPDIDHIYMAFTQAMSGSGGWPMSVFLTPGLKPFFAGTYFPPDSKYGRPGFVQVLTEISSAWQEQKQSIIESAEGIFEELRKHLNRQPEPVLISDNLSSVAANNLLGNFDHTYGGFGQAPKFPHPMELSLLLREYKRTGDLTWLLAAQKALNGMMRGGIYDQIGGGFARYSVDAKWLVPHFEKMLYDNALLARVYAEAFQVTGQEQYREVVRQTLDFVLREMMHPEGGFYSALDADSEGHEGLFYLWTADEIRQTLVDDAPFAMGYFNATDNGNFEGKYILHLSAESDRIRESLPADEFARKLDNARAALLAERNKRVRPLTDDKVLTSWNGLALSALAIGYRITGEPRFLEAARHNATFVMKVLYRDRKLTHAWREGVGTTGEFLEDYAYYISGLIDLYQSDPSADNFTWLQFARTLLDHAIPLFMDDSGALFLRPPDQADLIMRPSDAHDSSTPAPGSVFLQNLALMARLFDDESYRQLAEKGLRALSGAIARYPAGMCSALRAWELLRGDRIDIVIVGDTAETSEMRRLVSQRFLPQALVLSHPTGALELPPFQNRTSPTGISTAWICRNSVCRLPVTNIAEFEAQLAQI